MRYGLFCRYLYGFEEYCTSTAITFKMDLPLKQGPKREVKSEEEAGRAAPTASISEEQKTQMDGELCTPPSVLCKVPFRRDTLSKMYFHFDARLGFK